MERSVDVCLRQDDAPLTLDRDEDEEKRKAKAWQEDIANKFGAIDVGDKESVNTSSRSLYFVSSVACRQR